MTSANTAAWCDFSNSRLRLKPFEPCWPVFSSPDPRRGSSDQGEVEAAEFKAGVRGAELPADGDGTLSALLEPSGDGRLECGLIAHPLGAGLAGEGRPRQLLNVEPRAMSWREMELEASCQATRFFRWKCLIQGSFGMGG